MKHDLTAISTFLVSIIGKFDLDGFSLLFDMPDF